MSYGNVCRFCINPCHDYKPLYLKNGSHNKIYQIATKYFSMILNADTGHSLRVICSKCWNHIFNFHIFRKSILLSQSKLVEYIHEKEQESHIPDQNVENNHRSTSHDAIYYDIFVMDGGNKISTPELKVLHSALECPPEQNNDATIEIVNNADIVLKQEEEDHENKISTLQLEFENSVLEFPPQPFPNNDAPIEIVENADVLIKHEIDDDEFEVVNSFHEYSSKQNNDAILDYEDVLLEQAKEKAATDDSDTCTKVNYRDHHEEMCPPNSSKSRSRKSVAQLDSIIAQWRPILLCEICNEPYTNFKILQEHFVFKHPEEQCYIECCHHKMKSRSEIAEHARLHQNPNDFRCKICSKLLNGKHGLRYHMEARHNNNKQIVDNADCKKKTRKNGEELDSIIAQWRPMLLCKICNEPYATFNILKKHFLSKHQEECYIECCNRKLKRRNEVAEHARFHQNPSAFGCKICGLPRKGRRSLKYHMEQKHSNKQKQDTEDDDDDESIISSDNHEEMSDVESMNSFQENEYAKPDDVSIIQASMKTQTPKLFKRPRINTRKTGAQLDSIIAEWRPILLCMICNEPYPNFTMLKDHFLWKHPKEECFIECCNKKLKRRNEVADHASFHQNPNAFRCKICDKSFKGKSQLKYHIEQKHDDRKEKASTEDSDTYTNVNCNDHQEEINLVSNVESMNSTPEGDEEPAMPEVPIIHENAKRSSKHKIKAPNLSRIKRRKTGAQLDRIIAEWKPILLCMICNEPYPNFTMLKDHFLWKHPEEVCYIECCNYKMKRRSEMAEHARLHKNPNAFRCKICRKSLKGSSSLLVHMKHKHSNKLKFQKVYSKVRRSWLDTTKIDNLVAQWKQDLKCGVCNEPFKEYIQLRTHFKRHHPLKDCYIVCCKQKWHKRYLLEDHILLHIDPECFACKICGQKFSLKHSLKRHMTQQHEMSEYSIVNERISDAEQYDDHVAESSKRILSTRK